MCKGLFIEMQTIEFLVRIQSYCCNHVCANVLRVIFARAWQTQPQNATASQMQMQPQKATANTHMFTQLKLRLYPHSSLSLSVASPGACGVFNTPQF